MICASRRLSLLPMPWLITLWISSIAATTSSTASATAQPPATETTNPQQQVQRVVDGDTLRLADGEQLRLIGINTPELRPRGKRTGPAEPLAQAARTALQSLIAMDNPERLIALEPGLERRDRYGRLLAHVRHPNGRLLAAELLRQGLGWQALIPPNTTYWTQLSAAESEARRARRGVWGIPSYAARPVATLRRADTGFRRVLGIARPLGHRRTALLMGEQLYLPVPSASLQHFRDHWLWGAPDGACVEVRGWLVAIAATRTGSKAAQLRMALHHPALIQQRPAEHCRADTP